MQSSPWLLSDNFVSSMVDKKGHMALVGPGDPTGKGRGFSFTKDPRRVRASSAHHFEGLNRASERGWRPLQ